MRRCFLLAVLLAIPLASSLSAQATIRARAAEVTLGGYFQPQYSVSSVDGEDGGPDAVDDLLLRRARVTLDVRVGGRIDGRVEYDFAPGGLGLTDVYGRLTLARALRVSVGQFKRAFSIFELASDSDLPDIERDARIEGYGACPGVGGVCGLSRLTERLAFDERDVGVRAEGALGARVEYLATLTNGEGRNVPDANDAKSVSGRVVVALTPSIRLAGFAGAHDHVDVAGGTAYAQALGADLEVGAYRTPFHLLAGVARGDNWRAGPGADFVAVQALASSYIALGGDAPLAGIEPMLRVDRSVTEDGAGEEVEGLILTPGISLYLEGKNWIGINLDRYDPSPGESAWSLKTQLFLYY